MKKIYIAFLFFIFTCNAYSFESIVIPNNYSQTQSTITNEEFEELEKQVFKKSYKTDSPQKRLSRLEKEIFGMEQKGDEQERYENLVTAADYYKDGYRSQEPEKTQKPQYYTYEYAPKNYDQLSSSSNIVISPNEYSDDDKYYSVPKTSQQKPSKVKQFLNDLVEAFAAGAVTGYTTPVYYDIDPFAPNFIGYPQTPSYVRTPQVRVHPHHSPYYNPYIPRTTTYSTPYYPPVYRPYNSRTYYKPYPPMNTNFNTGTRVKIID